MIRLCFYPTAGGTPAFTSNGSHDTRVMAAALQGFHGGGGGRLFLRHTSPFSPVAAVGLSYRRRWFHHVCRAMHRQDVQVKEEGQLETLDYRVFFLDASGKKISPWHDIPLHLGVLLWVYMCVDLALARHSAAFGRRRV